jgi:hypothetical protein
MAALSEEELAASVAEWQRWRKQIDAPVPAAKAMLSGAALTSHDKALIAGIAPTIYALERELEKLRARVAELEARPTLKYLGTWREGKTYSAGTFITDAGSVWYCHASTSSRPGENADWQLAVKSGGGSHEPAGARAPERSDTSAASPRVNGHYANPRPR